MIASALALLLASAPPAAAPPKDQSTCFNEDSSTNWQPIDEHTLLVTSGGRSFRVTTATCPRLTHGIAQVQVVLPGGGYICGPHDAHLYVATPGGVGPIPCFMQAITPLTPAEAAALGRRR